MSLGLARPAMMISFAKAGSVASHSSAYLKVVSIVERIVQR